MCNVVALLSYKINSTAKNKMSSIFYKFIVPDYTDHNKKNNTIIQIIRGGNDAVLPPRICFLQLKQLYAIYLPERHQPRRLFNRSHITTLSPVYCHRLATTYRHSMNSNQGKRKRFRVQYSKQAKISSNAVS